MIITLAGHVDHGKTSIVHALTGIDTDRLEEEKRRGLTIDLGFAYTNVDDANLGFVDVPGHHRFIHNMVAGIAHQQHALLVVAADDGVMPQTLEHLQILELLGITTGVVALNKIDRVERDRIEVVRENIQSLLVGTFLETASVLEVSCADGSGINDLKAHLSAEAKRHSIESSNREFRLAIDRAFTVRGAGVIVTGTVVSGAVELNADLAVASTGQPVRLRELRVQDAPSITAGEGDRAAMNLSGISLEEIARGDWIVAKSTCSSTHHAVIELEVVSDYPRTVRHWAPAHVYQATSHSQGRIGLLTGAPIEPGQRALVDVVLLEPLHIKVADRLILRDQDLGKTLGGGRVIDVAPPQGRRRSSARQERLAAARNMHPSTALLELSKIEAVDGTSFRRDWNLTSSAFSEVIRTSALLKHREYVIHPGLLSQTQSVITDMLRHHHETHPDGDGITYDTIVISSEKSRSTNDIALETLLETNKVRTRSGNYSLVSHVAQVPTVFAELFQRIEPLLDNSQPPSLGDLAKALNRPLVSFEREMRALTAIGLCIQISSNRFFLRKRLSELIDMVVHLSQSGGFTVRQFRDETAIGRTVVIEVLEYFDRKGFTQRQGDVRHIVGNPSQVID